MSVLSSKQTFVSVSGTSAIFALSCGHSGLASTTTLTPTSLEELGFGLVRFGSTKCFRVFQPRPLSVEDGFKAGDNLLVRKIKTEGSNRN